MSFIPTINLLNDSPEQLARVIKDALGTVGFFAVENSGLTAEEIADMFKLVPLQSHGFFAQPTEAKLPYANDEGRGWIRPRTQALGPNNRPEPKETFLYGKHLGVPSTPAQPVPPPLDAERVKAFYAKCHSVSERLLQLFASALELEPEHFAQWHSYGVNTAMAMIYYPPLPAEERATLDELDIRAGEHQDWGTLTMCANIASLSAETVFQEPHGPPGLEVYLPASLDGSSTAGCKWYPAPVPAAGTFLVNVGLAMELWSSGQYHATLHRVIYPPGEIDARYSMTYFVQPDANVKFQPILPGGKIDTTAKAVTSGELWDFKQKETFERAEKMRERGLAVSGVAAY